MRVGMALFAWLFVSSTALAAVQQSALPAQENLLVVGARKMRQRNTHAPLELTLASGKRITVPSQDVDAPATTLVRQAMANQAYRPVDPAHLFVLHIREAIRESRSDVKVTLFSGNVIHVRSSDVNDARLTFLRTALAEAHSTSVTAQREERRSMAFAKTERAESAGAGSVEVRCNEPPVETFTPELESWLKRLLAHIRRSWFVPHERLSTKGYVRVRFVIHRDGRLTDLALYEASGVAEFNKAALSAVAAANPTEPLPPEYSPPTLSVCLTFEYNAAAK